MVPGLFSDAARKSKTGPKPTKLEKNDLESVAKYMKSGKCKNVFVMLGAGVSTSAGIPDFRSPETGLYANLARLNLPYPEAVFEINFFRRNPVPFYTLAQELYPGSYRPTLAHSFIKVLHGHRLLTRCFTQNIDTLERRAGVPAEKIVEAHGSFASQRCVECRRAYDQAKMKEKILEFNEDKESDKRHWREKVARCESCDGLVKPDIVFFGESLPPLFHRSIPQLATADLLIIMGTSLTVHPFASLVGMVPRHCPRVLINLEEVGDLGDRPDDVLYLGKCDDGARELSRLLGWEEELDREWEGTKNSLERRLDDEVEKEDREEGEEARVEREVEELTERVGVALAVSEREAEAEGKGDGKDREAGDTRDSRSKDETETKEEARAGCDGEDKSPPDGKL